MNTLAQGFALDALQVEPLTGIVSGPGGREKLDPKVMDVLVHMAGHAGQVVLREDLLARLWPNVVVTDDALTRCFYELRRCLARAGGDERYRGLLETMPKRGYRLNAAVRPLTPAVAGAPVPDPEPQPPQERRGFRMRVIASGAVLVALAALVYSWRSPEREEAPVAADATHSIAVLPFLDMSEKQDQRYFSDGVTEEILNRLSRSESLRVTSRTSSFALRNETLDVPQIASRLNVEYVLEGSVRRASDRVRITAQLIDADTNSHLWSDTYERGVGDIFAVQDEVARSVAAALEVKFQAAGLQVRSPARFAAYDAFLQGQFIYGRRSPGDVEKSIAHFERAVALDPGYARAWASLAGAYALMGANAGAVGTDWRAKQGAAAERAVALDPRLATAQVRLAQYYMQTGQTEKGEAHFQRAYALDPNDLLVLGYSAARATFRDDIAQAVEIWRQIVMRDPLSPMNRGNYANFLLRAGRLDQAIAEFRRTLELNPDAAAEDKARLAYALSLRNRHQEAESVIADIPEGLYRDYALSLLHGVPEQRTEADAAFARLTRATVGVEDAVLQADAYAIRGLHDDAFRILEARRAELLRDPEASARWRFWEFQEDLRLSYPLVSLHGEPRWRALTAPPS